MPIPVQNARASQALQSEFNLVGRYRPQLDETIVPVVLVSDVQGVSAPPLIRRAYARATCGAVAVQACGFRLEVPPGLVCVITTINSLDTGNFILGFGPAQLVSPAGTASESFIDNRLTNDGQNPAAAMTFGAQAANIAGPTKRLVNTNNLAGRSWQPNIVVAGTNGAFGFFEIQFVGDNVAITMEFEWTEYLPTS